MLRIDLTAHEARAIGCLIEKEITSADQYPLSLNALVNACNQKSNRDPVLSLDEATVQGVLDGLKKKHLVVERTGFGSRVPKFAHRFCNMEFAGLKFSAQELGVICELLLRGPQTPGELRTRTNRLCDFADAAEVEATLEKLSKRDDGPFVVQLAREPGRRESRYAHLFSGEVDPGAAASSPNASARSASAADSQSRLARLEQQVEDLRRDLDELRLLIDQLTDG